MFKPTGIVRAVANGRLRINPDRLNASLHHTCQWGQGHRYGPKATETGMRRLTLSDSDKQVRDWFVDQVQGLGCNVSIDQMGNIFAARPGQSSAPPTAMGSHLDTQPSGGRYDGILGELRASTDCISCVWIFSLTSIPRQAYTLLSRHSELYTRMMCRRGFQ